MSTQPVIWRIPDKIVILFSFHLLDIFELDNASLDFYRDENDNIINVDVKYLFHNIAGRDVTAYVTVEFYDKNNKILATGIKKQISLPEDYTEPSYLPANIVSYSGEYVTQVDHVKIIASEQLN